MHKIRFVRATVLALACSLSIAAFAQGSKPVQVDVPSGDLIAGLRALTEQSGAEFVYREDQLAGLRTKGVHGTLTAEQALSKLLEGSGYTVKQDPSGVLMIVKGASGGERGKESGLRSSPSRPDGTAPQQDEPVTDLPEMLVLGTRSLNADIQRDIDDPQPYVIFDRTAIERAGAISLNDFLLKRVSANTNGTSPSQTGEVVGDRSGINLRGLGENQTLILVDGRRLSNLSTGFSPGQPNLNGIPLSAVERIEVLPTTASAIYGGSATGGVINVVLRRDFEGGEIAISHDNSFDTDSSINRVDLAYGFSLGQGKTTVMLTGSWSEANALLNRDRDFTARGLAHIQRHSPQYLGLITPRPSTTPNLRSVTGVNLTLDDGTPLNAPVTHLPKGYLGPDSDGGAALIVNAGRVNTEPSAMASLFSGGGAFGATPRTRSASASIRHRFNDRLDGFLDLSHNQTESREPAGTGASLTVAADDPRNPFQQPIQVFVATDQFNTHSEQSNRTDRASAGLIARLPRDWAASLDFTWSKSSVGYLLRPGIVDNAALLASGFNPMIDHGNLGTLDLRPFAIGEINAIGVPVPAYSYNPTVRLSGPLWELPAGAVTASFLLEQQKSKYGQGAVRSFRGRPFDIALIFPPRSQDVRSAYAELRVPLFGEANARPGLQALEVQLAARYDDYRSTSGNSVLWFPNQTPAPPEFELVENASAETSGLLGLKYSPVQGLSLRASHGTGFVPPDVTQLGAPNRQDGLLSSTPDPRRGNTVSPLPITFIFGSNPNLAPEQSETTSIGLIVAPAALPDFRVSLDYTRLEKTDNITSLSQAQLIQHEALFPDRIQRGPKLPDDPADWAGPITFLDISRLNAATARLDTLDLQLRYGRELASGAYLEFWGNGTWTLKAEQQVLPGLAPNNLRGISAGSGQSLPLNFRGFYGVDLEKNGWGLGWTVRHYSSYLVADPALASSAPVIAAQGNGGRVPRQLLHDLSLRWRSNALPAGGGFRAFLANLEVNAGIRNVFDKEPEVDLSNAANFYSYLVDARLRTYYLQLKYLF